MVYITPRSNKVWLWSLVYLADFDMLPSPYDPLLLQRWILFSNYQLQTGALLQLEWLCRFRMPLPLYEYILPVISGLNFFDYQNQTKACLIWPYKGVKILAGTRDQSVRLVMFSRPVKTSSLFYRDNLVELLICTGAECTYSDWIDTEFWILFLLSLRIWGWE